MLRRALRYSFAPSRGLATAADSDVKQKIAKRKKSRFTLVGLPLLLFVVGGYVGLSQFVSGKYEARDHKFKSQSTRAFDLEEEHKKMTEKLMLDDYEIKPVPTLEETDDKK